MTPATSPVYGSLAQHFSAVLCVLLGLLHLPAPAAPLDAQALFQKTQPSVVEVLSKMRGNLGVAAGGSGFVVHRPDWIVTNYHVVTNVIYEPEDHELVVVTHDKKNHAARVIAVDVKNDLAILELSRATTAAPLSLRLSIPAKGEAGFSMGKPGQFSQGIVGGTFNGVIDEESAAQIVFSGAINGGMSGGPAMDGQGRVVGVNVASMAEDQLMGLVVPANEVASLLARLVATGPQDHAALLKAMAAQFALFGGEQVKRLSASPHAVRTLGPFTVQGDLAADKECATIRRNRPEQYFKMLEQRCDAAYGLYIMPKLTAGAIVTGTFWIQGQDLSDFAMTRLVEKRLNELRNLPADERKQGRWRCQEQRLRASAHVPIQLHACMRPVAKLPHLYDYRFRYTPLLPGKDALVVAIGLTGFDAQTARQVLQKSLASLDLGAVPKK